VKINPEHILLSRPDSIGDVMLTLPLCGLLKQYFPKVKITFLGKSYTQDIIEACAHVDHFLNWDQLESMSPTEQLNTMRSVNADVVIHVFPKKEIVWLAKKAGIRYRIATARRWYTLTKCNKPVFFSRRKSDLHESQLNIKLLSPLGIVDIPTLSDLNALSGFSAPNISIEDFFIKKPNQRYIILHCLSKGSAVNWSLKKFEELASLLLQSNIIPVITGTAAEGEKIKSNSNLISEGVMDLTGKLSLKQLIALIAQCDGLVAASTGPLHIASQLDKPVVGLYSPMRPIHAGRWAPIGKNAHVITAPEHPAEGELKISAEEVLNFFIGFYKS
jgi:ADP-heptose:LPS heptosyltransferase